MSCDGGLNQKKGLSLLRNDQSFEMGFEIFVEVVIVG